MLFIRRKFHQKCCTANAKKHINMCSETARQATKVKIFYIHTTNLAIKKRTSYTLYFTLKLSGCGGWRQKKYAHQVFGVHIFFVSVYGYA